MCKLLIKAKTPAAKVFIKLQNKAVRTLEYDKAKTFVLYSKHNILHIPDTFKSSIAKFIYSFYNGILPNHFDNYFTEIA